MTKQRKQPRSAPSPEPIIAPVCPYCTRAAVLVDSAEVYQRSYGMIWLCRPCQAWVGCHRNSRRCVPLGRLANAELRKLKVAAHTAFDVLWQIKMRRDRVTKNPAREAAYTWLAEQMQLDGKACHIGKFDEAQCRRVVDICRALGGKGGA